MRRLLAAILIAVGFLAVDASSASAQEVRQVPTTITFDCSKDVAGAIQSFLNASPNGSTVQFKAGGCYRVDSKLTVNGRTGMTIDGNLATFKRVKPTDSKPVGGGDCVDSTGAKVRPGHTGHWQVNSTNTVLKNMRLEGLNASGDYNSCKPFEHGVEIQSGQGVTVQGVTVSKVFGDGFYVQGGSNLTFRDSVIESNGRQGMGIVAGGPVLVDRVRIEASARGGIDFEPHPEKTLDGVEVRNSYFASNLLTFPAQGGGEVHNVYIHDNTIQRGRSFIWNHGSPPGKTGCRADARLRKNWRIENNVVKSKSGYGGAPMVFCNTQGVIVKGNTVPAVDGRVLILEQVSGTITVSGNCFPGANAAYVLASGTQNAPVNASDNDLSADCAGTPPATTKPPTSTTTTRPPTSTTKPPVTVPPTSPPTNLTPEQIAIRDAYVALKKICAVQAFC